MPSKYYRITKGKYDRKIISQYSLNGKLINEWDNASQISDLLGFDKSAILRCCKGIQQKSYSHIWKFKLETHKKQIKSMKSKVLSAGKKAWKTRLLNEKKNSKEEVESAKITLGSIKKFLKKRPDTSDMLRTILLNLNSSDAKLAKKMGKDELVIKRFRSYAIKSVMGKQVYAGKHKKKQNVATDYKSNGKTIVREAVMKMLLDSKSVKTGIVPTLPFNFEFEKMLIKVPALKGLFFNGYEFGYNATKNVECRKHFKVQLKMLEKDKTLASRILMRFENINKVLVFGGENQYAHIFADYCGNFSTNKDAIEHIISNNLIKKGGLLWITLNARSTNGDRNLKEVLPNFVEKIGGSNYKIEKIEGERAYSYKGSISGKGAPTLALVVRRIK